MKTKLLSERLARIASYVLPGMRVADIGSDHAYLPAHLVQYNDVPFAIAGEVADGPFESALQRVDELKLHDKIEVRKGDGLDVLANREVDCVTIAGMGGPLIASILERGKARLENVQRLILQPNVGARTVRRWLMENDWKLIAEEIIEENEKIYEVLVGEKGTSDDLYREDKEAQLLLGPFLQKEKNAAFIKKWQAELVGWQSVLDQLSQASQSTDVTMKRQEIQAKITIVEEVLYNEKN